jgi:dienelactone hydrolase
MRKLGYLDGLDPTIIERWKSVRTHAFLDIPLIALPTRLPLLLFSPGFGVSRSNYTVLMEELASHGFIVAAIDHPYGGVTILPGGRILTIREDPGPPAMTNLARIDMMTKDASKVLDVLLGIGSKALARFAGRIDTERIGAIGHSLGGAVALEAGRKDTRVKACIDLDGDVWADTKTYRLARPSLILLNEPIIESPSDAFRKMQAARKADWAALAQANPEFPPDVFTIRGTNHFVFTDGPFVMPDFVRAQPGKLGDLGEAVNSIMALVRGFFDVQLNGKPSPLLGDPSRVYPEVKRYVERTGLRV